MRGEQRHLCGVHCGHLGLPRELGEQAWGLQAGRGLRGPGAPGPDGTGEGVGVTRSMTILWSVIPVVLLFLSKSAVTPRARRASTRL